MNLVKHEGKVTITFDSIDELKDVFDTLEIVEGDVEDCLEDSISDITEGVEPLTESEAARMQDRYITFREMVKYAVYRKDSSE